uniref:Uncharacterized protein n=1 Tax=Pithovirus LCPAC103 TaxID=2506588 RepID=A0A481Z4D8_9VIRU|nr:MAG: hypothetical protein LCPAC103_01370 [Pithovirus LCPAC103]
MDHIVILTDGQAFNPAVIRFECLKYIGSNVQINFTGHQILINSTVDKNKVQLAEANLAIIKQAYNERNKQLLAQHRLEPQPDSDFEDESEDDLNFEGFELLAKALIIPGSDEESDSDAAEQKLLEELEAEELSGQET